MFTGLHFYVSMESYFLTHANNYLYGSQAYTLVLFKEAGYIFLCIVHANLCLLVWCSDVR